MVGREKTRTITRERTFGKYYTAKERKKEDRYVNSSQVERSAKEPAGSEDFMEAVFW